jgi:sugar diacid utilization regulator
LTELQDLVDALATCIARSVVIDDQRFHLVAFSSHNQEIDEVRRASILARETPEEVARWLIQRGLARAQHPVHLEAVARLGMRARVCIPIRFDGLLCGYLSVIEDTRKLTEGELAECVTAATDAGALMYRERVLDDHLRRQERQCVVDLLDSSGHRRSAAARAALDGGLLIATGAYGVIALEPRSPLESGAEEHAVGALAALERTRRSVRPHGCVTGNLGTRGVLIAAVRDGDDGAAELSRIAERLLSALGTSGSQSGNWRLGQGPAVGELAHVAFSCNAALDAIRIAAAIPEVGEIAAWDDLGAWRLLSLIPPDGQLRLTIHPGLARVAELRDGEALLETLEAYLDSGGDAQRTASKLFIHRTSLYARLRRIERDARVDLSNGEDRLALHMSLRLARLNRDETAGVNGNGAPPSATDARAASPDSRDSRRVAA